MTIRDLFTRSLFTQPPILFAAASSAAAVTSSTDNPNRDPFDNGLFIGTRKRGQRFVRYPDGEIRTVDVDFDREVFNDPDSSPKAKPQSVDASTDEVPANDSETDAVQAIAAAMIAARPGTLVAVAHTAKGEVIAATATAAKRGLTPATFRAAMRSLPANAKQVTFAASGSLAMDVQEAALVVADAFLVRILNFIAV
ncbi:hypothetical protein LF1_41610 [Rubripirellula obstinata]|uniref:Uncharacterized protein n=2 Tax=Rubripirellula obstinata TaxID=406547 RepID=A0A5B1CPQ6_9BACT|nr:hypothetical protein [Rubripirellula obstinata]KAA1261610.1 hypothetical protein LF1_41610 [Rubripirellula obstinata]